MKYSFLVPVYNVEKYLEQCIESMLGQTYRDFEIILVDDGSTDSSGKICDEYKEKYPDIIKVIHKENEGLVSAREWGIHNANGEICLFVDSDDFIEKNLLETIDPIFVSDESIDIVVFNLSYFDNNKKLPRKVCFCDDFAIIYAQKKRQIYEALMFSVTVSSLCLKAVKTSLFKSDNTDYSIYYKNSMGEDQFRSIHLFTLAEKICYINKPLYCYRVDNFSISRNFDYERIAKKNMLYIYDEFIKYLRIWDIEDSEIVARLQAQWLSGTIYMFNQYYKAAKSGKQRKAVVDFDWDSFVPEITEGNKYISETVLKTYRLIKAKKYFSLYFLYIKNNYHKILKKFLQEKLCKKN